MTYKTMNIPTDMYLKFCKAARRDRRTFVGQFEEMFYWYEEKRKQELKEKHPK